MLGQACDRFEVDTTINAETADVTASSSLQHKPR
jgi:hypothetical protein